MTMPFCSAIRVLNFWWQIAVGFRTSGYVSEALSTSRPSRRCEGRDHRLGASKRYFFFLSLCWLARNSMFRSFALDFFGKGLCHIHSYYFEAAWFPIRQTFFFFLCFSQTTEPFFFSGAAHQSDLALGQEAHSWLPRGAITKGLSLKLRHRFEKLNFLELFLTSTIFLQPLFWVKTFWPTSDYVYFCTHKALERRLKPKNNWLGISFISLEVSL